MLSLSVFGSVLAASLVGSPHCVGMCGGLVAAVSSRGSSLEVFSYHAFRVLGYTSLGAVFGWAGARINDLGVWVGLRAAAPILIAAVLLVQLISVLMGHSFKVPMPGGRLWARFKMGGGAGATACTGLMTSVLPCGWLYSFFLLAIGTGHPFSGAWVLFAFGLGTVPILVATGFALRTLLARRHLATRPVTAALLFLAASVSLVQHARIVPSAPHESCHAKNSTILNVSN